MAAAYADRGAILQRLRDLDGAAADFSRLAVNRQKSLHAYARGCPLCRLHTLLNFVCLFLSCPVLATIQLLMVCTLAPCKHRALSAPGTQLHDEVVCWLTVQLASQGH